MDQCNIGNSFVILCRLGLAFLQLYNSTLLFPLFIHSPHRPRSPQSPVTSTSSQPFKSFPLLTHRIRPAATHHQHRKYWNIELFITVVLSSVARLTLYNIINIYYHYKKLGAWGDSVHPCLIQSVTCVSQPIYHFSIFQLYILCRAL